MNKDIFNDIIHFSPSIIFIKDLEGRILYMNHENKNIFKHKSNESIEQKDTEHWPKEVTKKFKAQDQEVIKTGIAQVWEDSLNIQGVNRTYITNKFLLFDSKYKPYALCGIATDITERKQTEERLRKYQAELEELVEKRMKEIVEVNKRLRMEIEARILTEKELIFYQDQLHSLSSEMLLAEERERRRIAEGLHDQIGHALAITKIKIEKLQSIIQETNITLALEELHDLIDQTINDTRSFIFDLIPPILYELGLVAAVEWLAEKFQKDHGVRIIFSSNNYPDSIEESLRFLLFRAINELLLNAVKHGKAKIIRVAIMISDDQANIDIVDNGIGFDVACLDLKNNKNIGFGLFSISERLKKYGGILAIKSKSNNGTQVHIESMLKKNGT